MSVRFEPYPDSVQAPPHALPYPDEGIDPGATEMRIIQALRTIYDPEIPVDIFDLGLIYGIDIDPAGCVLIRMTLTAPGCPVAGSLPAEVEEKLAGISGVSSVRVDLVWDPPWSLERASEAARLTLGF